MSTLTLNGHIEETPGVCGGRPRIAGRRITVEQIVVWHDRLGRGVDEIAAEYDLSPADIHAALTYYFDHRAEIDRRMVETQAWIEELRAKTPSRIAEKLAQGFANG